MPDENDPVWASEDEARDRPIDDDVPADVDPYSVAIQKIRDAVRVAIVQDAINERERRNLVAIEEYVRMVDNA